MTYRLHLKNRRRFFLLMALLGFLAILSATILTAGASTRAEANTVLVTVQAGETLWDLATVHCANGDIRSYISDVKHLNEMENSIIYAGQSLLLPVR